MNRAIFFAALATILAWGPAAAQQSGGYQLQSSAETIWMDVNGDGLLEAVTPVDSYRSGYAATSPAPTTTYVEPEQLADQGFYEAYPQDLQSEPIQMAPAIAGTTTGTTYRPGWVPTGGFHEGQAVFVPAPAERRIIQPAQQPLGGKLIRQNGNPAVF